MMVKKNEVEKVMMIGEWLPGNRRRRKLKRRQAQSFKITYCLQSQWDIQIKYKFFLMASPNEPPPSNSMVRPSLRLSFRGDESYSNKSREYILYFIGWCFLVVLIKKPRTKHCMIFYKCNDVILLVCECVYMYVKEN